VETIARNWNYHIFPLNFQRTLDYYTLIIYLSFDALIYVFSMYYCLPRGLIKFHTEEFYYFNSSPNIVRIIKLKRMRWQGHVARMGAKTFEIFVGKPEGRRSQ
jgi:hypothetical protein